MPKRREWEDSDSEEDTLKTCEVKRIVGEELLATAPIGKIEVPEKYLRYEVRRKGRRRTDKTNTTWEHDLSEFDEEARHEWAQDQASNRAKLAGESMDIQLWGNLDMHLTPTRLTAQGFAEKLSKRQQNPINISDWDKRMEELMGERYRGGKKVGSDEDVEMDVDDVDEEEEAEEESEEEAVREKPTSKKSIPPDSRGFTEVMAGQSSLKRKRRA